MTFKKNNPGCRCCLPGDFCSCDGIEFVDSISVVVDFPDTITAYREVAATPTEQEYQKVVASGFAIFNGTYVFDNTNTQSDDGCNWDPFSYFDTISIQFDVSTGIVPRNSVPPLWCPDVMAEGPVSTSTMNYSVSLSSPGIFGDFATAKVGLSFAASGTPPYALLFQNINVEVTACTNAIFPFRYDYSCTPLDANNVLSVTLL